ncbi:hypothetical protein OSB04_un000298 [Centaurea solstitialis]|uniref:Reverse transcriptase domain-containing protein n=1 Tax=Centaurea solstitialis TaxID=347529 RepID=A0AA38SHQ5_9ASTR|nr:hypothetical protein OSB04_un000298 [Centaurea solstitialis]
METTSQSATGSDGLGAPDPTMVVTDITNDASDDEISANSQGDTPPVRVSVFDRLETDARLKFNPSDMNFAKAVGTADSATLAFFPLATKAQTCVHIPKELASEVVEAGPLMIRGVPLFVEHWDPVKGLSKPIHTSCPLWVKLHNIPLVAFNKEGISRIASALGVPKQMDACTASMCDKAWGRPGFAKVLIETWAVGELKRELQVVIPNLAGGEDVRIAIKVEYLWEPSQCAHCLVFGHKTTSCAKAVAAQLKKGKAAVVDEDGFTKVQRKEWRPKVVGSSPGTKNDVQQIGHQHTDGVSIVSSTPTGGAGSDAPVVQMKEVVQSDAGTATLSNTLDEGMVHENLNAQSGHVERKDATNKEGLGTSVLRREAVRETRHFTAPLDVPLKTILKNPNRFAPLEEGKGAQSGKDDGSKDKKGSSPPVIIRQGLDAPKKPGGMLKLIMFNLAFWNIRGMNAVDKQQELRSLISNNNLHVCAVLETHLRLEVLQSVCDRTFRRWAWVSNQAQSNHGTRIIVAWDQSVVDVMVLESHNQFMHCQIKFRDSQDIFLVSFVYGANRGLDRRALWSGLRQFQVLMGDRPWLAVGDFNCMLFPHDALGGASRRNSDMVDFAAFVEDVDLFDIRFSGIHHTWSQKPKDESGLLRKLDRILANTSFTSSFQDCSARFLPRGISDHSPGVVSFNGKIRKRNFGFKFDNFLVTDAQFLPIVKHWWSTEINGTFMYKLTSKLKLLKAPFRKLRSSYGNLTETTQSLKHELDTVQLATDLYPSDMGLKEDLEHLRVAYQQACWNDMCAAKQRAKVKWLSQGDSNTKYFHQVVKEKRNSHHIHSVCNSEGVFVYDLDVATAFIDHFKMIIGSRDDTVNPHMPLDLFTRKLELGDSLHMIRAITDEEIKGALFQIGNDKAPGPDGFSAKFFKSAWEVIGGDVLLAIHNFFYRSRLPKELNHTLLCLLPKSINATSVTDFRPIACCTVLYKCIAKVLVNRMKPFLDGIIGNYQSAFIPGRKISDNILMAHELVKGYHLNSGPPRCAFKIDLRKAYDMVNWDFLFNMLAGLGFHPVIIKWITVMVSSPSFSIALNGESFGNFQGQRGIRQGDPLSPYLFTIIMEGFAMIFKECINEASNFQFHHGCQELGITHLCFADDLFVFTHGDVHSVGVVKKALDVFAMRSGLSPNLQKSDIFFGHVPLDEKTAILDCLAFRQGTFPIRYLGVPLSPIALRASDYSDIVAKVKDRVQNWKSKFLSFGGRRQLILSVLQSLQLYWMAVFLFPSVTIHDLESCFRDFLWTQGATSKGRCKVAWTTICKPLESGGLGVKRLSVWNRALLTKNLWAILSRANTLWVQWIRLYSLRGNFWAARRHHRWSWTFARMMTIRDEIRRYVTVRIGDGLSTNAWEDSWLPCGALSSIIPYRVFHVRRAYGSLVGHFDRVDWTKMVWFKGHIPKHAFCLWLACLRRLPTQDRMYSWKQDHHELRCSLCNACMDSHSHLFFECSFASDVWSRIKVKVNWLNAPTSWDVMMDVLAVTCTSSRPLMQKLALSATVYMIWQERNTRLFTANHTHVIELVKNIMDVVQLREAWKKRKHVTSLRLTRIWTACLGRLPTQDHLSIWKENPPDLTCSLCESCIDSHDHLFFTCSYSREIWRKVKREVSLHGFPESWTLIMEMLNEGRGPVKLIQRLALAATIYFIWEERNNRLFNKAKKIGVQLFKEIRSVIMERMAYRSSLLMISR